MDKRLTGKNVVITGGNKGLGRGIAELFAEEGGEVAIIARNETELKSVADGIEKSGGHCFYLPIDVSNSMEVERCFNEIKKRWTKLDALINSAAVAEPINKISLLGNQDWDKIIKINLNGPFYCAKHAMGLLANGGNSSIINVTSSLATLVWPYFTAYGVTKGGLNSLTLYLAEELKPLNIRVFGLDPGAMDTPMWQYLNRLDPEQIGQINQERIEKLNEKLASPQSVARLALFLVTEATTELSGKIGGFTYFQKYGFSLS